MILPRILKSVYPQNLIATALILLVVVLVNVAALYASYQAGTIQGTQTMRRESQPVHYLVALDTSYQHGPQAVDWNKVVWNVST